MHNEYFYFLYYKFIMMVNLLIFLIWMQIWIWMQIVNIEHFFHRWDNSSEAVDPPTTAHVPRIASTASGRNWSLWTTH